MSKLISAMKEVARKRAELTEQAKAVLADGIKEFMTEHPEVVAIGWQQYAPYFNDGDECVFSVHTLSVTLNPEYNMEDGLHGKDWHELYSYRGAKVPEGFTPALWTELIEFGKLIENAADDMRSVFGEHEHVQVIVTQNGIEVEEYEHH